MRIPRIYHPDPLIAKSCVTLTDSAANHVARVLRMPMGAPLILFNGEGGEFSARIVRLGKREVTVMLDQFSQPDNESPLFIHLGQGLSRAERMDYTIQKAVELGVHSITPLVTDFCQVRLSPERLEKRIGHWQAIIISACEQCGRHFIPRITPPQTLLTWVQHPFTGLRLLLHPHAQQRLSDIVARPTNIQLLIGAEGGLSDGEVQLATQYQFQALRLGTRILRTETAAVAALALLQGAWGDLH